MADSTLLDLAENRGSVIVAPAERAHEEQLVITTRQHHPLPSPSLHQRPRSKVCNGRYGHAFAFLAFGFVGADFVGASARSEERRVGKECVL